MLRTSCMPLSGGRGSEPSGSVSSEMGDEDWKKQASGGKKSTNIPNSVASPRDPGVSLLPSLQPHLRLLGLLSCLQSHLSGTQPMRHVASGVSFHASLPSCSGWSLDAPSSCILGITPAEPSPACPAVLSSLSPTGHQCTWRV